MKASIVHESRGRMRLRLAQRRLTLAQADRLYTIARASGTSDPEMDELYRLADEWP